MQVPVDLNVSEKLKRKVTDDLMNRLAEMDEKRDYGPNYPGRAD